MPTPLFVCHANCARSVLAYYLYRHLCNSAPALSAGMEAGERTDGRAGEMLLRWRVEHDHRPTQLTRALCDRADAIFLMAPNYVHRMLKEYGADLAAKAYLFADPFARPRGFARGEFRVKDPSFDPRPAEDRLREWSWMRERVLQIRLALLGDGRPLVPATEYLELCLATDPRGH
jgi:protein-tyrosine-phosphatase